LDRGRVAGADHPCAASHARPEVADHGEDGRRVDVHAADDEHIVATSKHALPIARPPTLARGSLDAHDVTAEKAHDRHRLARQRGVHELADGAGLDLHWRARVRIDELGPHMPGAAEVHALLVRTLTKKRGSDVADAHHLGDGDAQHALDVIADGWNSAARFAAGHDVGQSERTWVGIALLIHALDLVRRYAQVAAERRVLVKGLLQLLLGREGEI